MYFSLLTHILCLLSTLATTRATPTAPPAPRFTIETEDEESGNNGDPREKDQGIELTTRSDTYNPIGSSQQAGVQENMSV